MPTYKIVRYYQERGRGKRTLRRGLTRAEAMAHCDDPESSSKTCRKAVNRRRTKQLGDWFDGWTAE